MDRNLAFENRGHQALRDFAMSFLRNTMLRTWQFVFDPSVLFLLLLFLLLLLLENKGEGEVEVVSFSRVPGKGIKDLSLHITTMEKHLGLQVAYHSPVNQIR